MARDLPPLYERVLVSIGTGAMGIARQAGGIAVLLGEVLWSLFPRPRMDGREVLAELQKDPKLRKIPVIVLTTSEGEEDILAAYEMNANCYITKPVDWKQFVRVVEVIEDFWLTVVRLPKELPKESYR